MSCLNFIGFSFHFSFPRMCASFYSYRVVKEVGDGTFGCVWRAVNKFTGEIVCYADAFSAV